MIATAPPITVDGATPIIIEFHCPQLVTGNGNASRIDLFLFDGSTSLGYVGSHVTPTSASLVVPGRARRRLTPSAGTHTYSIRGVSTVVAGTIQAGAGGAGQNTPGYIRIQTATPVAAPSTNPTYGTTFPATPANGQEHVLVDSVTNPTYQWRFRYNASSTSPYRWEFVGGSAAYAEVTASEGPGSTINSYVALTTAGPSIALPYGGDFLVEIGFRYPSGLASAHHQWMSYDIGATGAVDADAIILATGSDANQNPGGLSRVRRKNGLGAVLLAAKYKIDVANGVFADRWMRVTPVRVG